MHIIFRVASSMICTAIVNRLPCVCVCVCVSLRTQIAQLKRELESVRGHRQQYRDRRASVPIPVVSLVGYTNAGKSTLLNRLSGAGVLAEDRLFATLDPTTRRVELPNGKECLFTDTVGFIQKLPTQLVGYNSLSPFLSFAQPHDFG
jgi:GTP-binding protein HflX